MRKFILPIIIFGISLIGNTQDTVKNLSKGVESFSISAELGAGSENVSYFYNSMIKRTEFVSKPMKSLSLTYKHQFIFNRKHSLIMGLGFTYSMFYHGLYFTNSETQYNPNPKKRLIGDWWNSFFSIDIPIQYKRNLFIGKRLVISPYFGIKIRYISYIQNEDEIKDVSTTSVEVVNQDTVFFMQYKVDNSTYRGRVVPFGTIGLEISKKLKNNNKLSFFIEYNRSAFNSIETYFSNLDNLENNNYYSYSSIKVYMKNRLDNINIGITYSIHNKRFANTM